MKRWFWRLVLLGVVLAIGGFILAASGIIPLKASSGHWAVTEWMLRFGMKRSVATHSLTVHVPENLTDPDLILKGAGHYDVGCRGCHGEPGRPLPRIATRMLPPPPELKSRIHESSPRKLFYVVKHGLKFTGMPAWPATDRDDEVWAVVAFLLRYPELDATDYSELVGRKTEPTASFIDAASDPQPPRDVVESCARCHGDAGLGRSSPAFPKLAGQRSEYLQNALQAYASGRRHSGMMEPVAAGLTKESVTAVAEYYSRIRTEDSTSATRTDRPKSNDDPAAIARGRTIALEGIPAQRIPACVECHGPGGRRRKPDYPLLAGQFAEYLELQLTLFREDRRGGSAYAHLMQPVASRLKPEQVRDVTAYFASLRGAEAGPRANAARDGSSARPAKGP